MLQKASAKFATADQPLIRKPLIFYLILNLYFHFPGVKLHAVYGVCLLGLPRVPLPCTEFSTRGGFYGPQHCQYGSTL